MSLSGKTAMLAIIAHPVAHVRAPDFYNPQFTAKGLDAFIVPMQVLPKDLPDVLPRLQKLRNFRGLVVTIPHKEVVAKLCNDLRPAGRLAGAVNAVRFEPDGKLTGDMFDGIGLLQAMKEARVGLAGRRVLLVGAGGAGRAIAMSFAAQGIAGMTIANRAPARAEQLAADVRKHFPTLSVAAGSSDPSGHDVIVNATSLGLHDSDPAPLDLDRLRREMDVVEIIAPVEWTPFRARGRDLGCRTVGGRPMAERQVDAMIDFFHLRAGNAGDH